MEETWIKHYWRPTLAYSYVVICLFDFMMAPIMNALLSYYTGAIYIPWTSLTMSEGGFYHIAMGATIGVSAWSRGQEKIKRILTGEEAISEPTTTTTETQTPVKKDK